MEYSVHSKIKDLVALVLAAITTNTTTAGVIIDTLGFESMEYIVQSGDITDGAYALLLEEGEESNLSDAVVVDPSLVRGALTGFTASDDDDTIRVGCIGKKRYQRLSIVSTGTSSGVDRMGAIAILGNPKHGLIPQ